MMALLLLRISSSCAEQMYQLSRVYMAVAHCSLRHGNSIFSKKFFPPPLIPPPADILPYLTFPAAAQPFLPPVLIPPAALILPALTKPAA